MDIARAVGRGTRAPVIRGLPSASNSLTLRSAALRCRPWRQPCAQRRQAPESQPPAADESWAALANQDDLPDEEDPEFVSAFNKLCNTAVRSMLRNDGAALDAFKEELSEAGQFFVQQGQRRAATFAYVLYNMVEHRMVAEADQLEGMYKEAFLNVFGLIEDSGWALVREGEEDEEEDAPLEEVRLPPTQSADDGADAAAAAAGGAKRAAAATAAAPSAGATT